MSIQSCKKNEKIFLGEVILLVFLVSQSREGKQETPPVLVPVGFRFDPYWENPVRVFLLPGFAIRQVCLKFDDSIRKRDGGQPASG